MNSFGGEKIGITITGEGFFSICVGLTTPSCWALGAAGCCTSLNKKFEAEKIKRIFVSVIRGWVAESIDFVIKPE